MKPMTKAVVVVMVQILLISSLGAKLLYDRRTCPNAWFKTRPYDPNLPIRGRYISLQVELKDTRSPEEIESKFRDQIKANENRRAKSPLLINNPFRFGNECGSIVVRGSVPEAVFDQSGTTWNCKNLSFFRLRREGAPTDTTLLLTEPILFFLPDTAQDPSHLNVGDELWVQATIPRKGPPRPIRLGIKKADETNIRPLQLN